MSLLQFICTIKFVVVVVIVVVVAYVSLLQFICTMCPYLHNQVCDFINYFIISLCFFFTCFFFLSRNQGKLVVPLHEEALNVVFILESV